MGTLRAVKIVRRRDFGNAHPFDREFNGIQRFEPVSRGHPGLVDILQVGRNEAEGCFYHVMELGDPAEVPTPGVGKGDGRAGGVPAEVGAGAGWTVPGGYVPRTLRRELKAHGRLPLPECLRVGLALAGGLEHLHRHGLVHRDVKPSNIIFVDGQPKLADIGLVAPVDEARSLVGTAGYIPPEGPGTPEGDVYSLGKVLYEAAFGKDRQEFPQLPPDLASRPDHGPLLELNAILLRACESDPARRYRSAGAMAADLERVRDGRPVRGRRPVPKAPALVAGLLALLWLAWPTRSPAPPPIPAAPAGERASVFVLPFREETPGQVAADLRGRLADAFLDGLALMEGVRVGPRRSGWEHLDEDAVRRALAGTNALRHVLTARVGAGGGGRLTLGLSLWERTGDRPAWTGRFAGQVEALPDLERRALRGLTDALGLKLSAAEGARLDSLLPRNLEALALVRQARESYQREAGTEAGHQRIQSLAQRALELDPGFLEADFLDVVIHRDLAWSKAPREQWPNVRARALRLLEQDESHAGALGQMGHYLLSFARDWDALPGNVGRELAATDPARRDLVAAKWFRTFGWLEEARVRQEQGERAGATDWVSLFHQAAARRVERRPAEAVAVARRLVALHPGVGWGSLALAHSLVAAGDFEAALAAIQPVAGTLQELELQALRAYALARLGRAPEARVILAELVAAGRHRYLQPYHVARVQAALGDSRQALAWLQQAEADKSEFLLFADVGGLRTDPAWDVLKSEPEFWALCDRLGLGRRQWPRPRPEPRH